jgi:hypothetical protein
MCVSQLTSQQELRQHTTFPNCLRESYRLLPVRPNDAILSLPIVTLMLGNSKFISKSVHI